MSCQMLNVRVIIKWSGVNGPDVRGTIVGEYRGPHGVEYDVQYLDKNGVFHRMAFHPSMLEVVPAGALPTSTVTPPPAPPDLVEWRPG